MLELLTHKEYYLSILILNCYREEASDYLQIRFEEKILYKIFIYIYRYLLFIKFYFSHQFCIKKTFRIRYLKMRYLLNI